MNRRVLTILMALMLAASGSLLVFAYVHGADNRALRNQRSVEVLVATKSIPGGTPVAKLQPGGYVTVKRFPAVSLPDDVLGRIGDADDDLVVSASIKSGELIRRTLLVQRGETQAFTIPDGKLAVTVALTDPRRVAGYVKVGSKVAVFITVRLLDPKTGKPKGDLTGTKMLMAGVEVLSIAGAESKEAQRAGGDSEPRNLMTLAVTQLQAEKLIWGATGPPGTQSALYMGLEGASSELNEKSPGVSGVTVFN